MKSLKLFVSTLFSVLMLSLVPSPALSGVGNSCAEYSSRYTQIYCPIAIHGNLVQALEGTSSANLSPDQILASPAIRTLALDRTLANEKYWFPSLTGPHSRQTVLEMLFDRNIETYLNFIREEAPSSTRDAEVRQFQTAIASELEQLPPSAPGTKFYLLNGYWDISVNAFAALALDESTGNITLILWGDEEG